MFLYEDLIPGGSPNSEGESGSMTPTKKNAPQCFCYDKQVRAQVLTRFQEMGFDAEGKVVQRGVCFNYVDIPVFFCPHCGAPYKEDL